MRFLRKLCALTAVAIFGMAAGGTGNSQAAINAARSPSVDDRPISSGFVLFEGEYLAPPYTLVPDGEDLLINGRRVSARRAAGPRADNLRAEGSSVARTKRQSAPFPFWVRMRQELQNDASLIVLDGKLIGVVPYAASIKMFDALLSDHSDEEKSALLAELNLRWMHPERWARVVAAFRPTAELVARVTPQIERNRLASEANTAAHETYMRSRIFHSRPVTYTITVATMLLAVIATGRLLTHRPNTQAPWREIDSNEDGVTVLLWNVVLVFLFGVLDLGLSLIADQAGGFLELNPLGSQLTATPMLLTVFKLASLLIACLILVGLRRYRGAQVASWWLCLVGAILTFRWLTYNSLFLS